MFHRKELYLFVVLLVAVFTVFAGNQADTSVGNDTVKGKISQDETILFNMINDMRRQGKLQPIPLSQNLCIVALTHIDDLFKWKPQEKGCSLHSWSGSGKWSPCCNSKDLSGIQCMKSKPKEITGYIGNGYELIYWGEENATPTDAAALWQQVDASSDMILCRGKWKGYQWKALGVGIKNGYAILWLGDVEDRSAASLPSGKSPIVQETPAIPVPASGTPLNEKKEVKMISEVKTKEKPTSEKINPDPLAGSGTKYYLIVSSVKTSESAKTELAKVKAKGYPEAFILEGESVFRIALASFDTSRKATSKQNELKSKFPGIWVYKK